MFINDRTCGTGADVRPRHLNGRALPEMLRLVFKTWPERRRQRRHLDELSDHSLRDIGLTRSQARREARRWFFD
jgi:uncharacterized protein YjiS (DUF1127 family)